MSREKLFLIFITIIAFGNGLLIYGACETIHFLNVITFHKLESVYQECKPGERKIINPMGVEYSEPVLGGREFDPFTNKFK